MQKLFIIICMNLTLVSMAQVEDEKDWRLYTSSKSSSQVELEQKTPETKVIKLTEQEQGEIRYIQDERISVLDDYLKSHPIRQDGYRIQLVFGSRSEVSSYRSKFLAQWRYSAYETYLAPNFRLRVGDFINRWQAEKALRELKTKFPNAYIVRDKIEIPDNFR